MRELLVVNLLNGKQQTFEGSMRYGDIMAIHGQFLLTHPQDIILSDQLYLDSVFQLRCENGYNVYAYHDSGEVLLGSIKSIEIHSE